MPLGTRLSNIRRHPVTLIGANQQYALVRSDAGKVEAIEIGELTHALTTNEEAFNQQLRAGTHDTLSHLGSLLAELQLLDPPDPEDNIDAQTIEEARGMRERIGRRVAALCEKTFVKTSQSALVPLPPADQHDAGDHRAEPIQ